MNALEALARCQRAWEATQPQLFFELWPDDGLDETELRVPLGLVEPAVAVASPEAGGLAVGAEPCRDLLGTDGKSFLLTAPASPWTGSAPLSNTTGPDAPPAKGTRPAQEVTS